MPKQSAGILIYRRKNDQLEVLLAHPGGPFWAKKDLGAWSVPKGEFAEGENPITAARREFQEELGKTVPEGELIELGSFKRPDGKTIYVWAVEGDLDTSSINSNYFEMEWPPKSGQKQSFPEIDKAAWFDISQAAPKLHKGQAIFLERLAEKLKVTIQDQSDTSIDQKPSDRQITLL